MKKLGLLGTLMVVLFALSVTLLVLAGVAYKRFELGLENNASRYLEVLVDNVSTRIERYKWHLRSDTPGPSAPFEVNENTISTALKSHKGLGIYAVYRNNGEMLYCSQPSSVKDFRRFEAYFTSAVPRKIFGEKGNYLTGMRADLKDDGIYIIGLVSWKRLFGDILFLSTVWPFVMGVIAFLTIAVIILIVAKIVIPLRLFEKEVASLHLGTDTLNAFKEEPVPELQRLRDTIARLSRDAVDKERLLRDYITDIVKVQEEERERISRELHDGPLQDVTALVQRLRLIALDTEDESLLESLNSAENVAMIGVKEMREMCNNLTPPWLDLGLRRSVEELCSRMQQQLGIKIHLDTEDMDELDDESVPAPVCLALYRVLQESINNSVSHGSATSISVTLKEEDDKVTMNIKDDGRGFTPPDDEHQLRVLGHRGLSNMKERIRIVGGSMKIISALGIGTLVCCEVPLKSESEKSVN